MIFVTPKIKVYIKVDSSRNIIAIVSSIFLTDTTGWIEIDAGIGDRFVHAQGNYLPVPCLNEHGLPNYKYIPGGDPPFEERTEEEKAAELAALPPPPVSETDLLKAQVQALTERGEFLEDVIAELAMMLL